MQRTVVVHRAKMGEENSLAEHYRRLSADDKMQDFLRIQQAYLVAMGYKEYPKIERVLQFRKMKSA